MGVGRYLQGGFQQYAECINVHVVCPQRGSGRMSPHHIWDYKPEIASDVFWEYRERIPRIMQTARLVFKAYTLASVAL